MAGRNVSVEDAIRTLHNIVAPPGQAEEESDEEEYFQGLREGIKKKKSNTKNPEKTKKPRTKKKKPKLRRRASIAQYGSGDLFGTRGNYEKSLLYRSRLGGIPDTYSGTRACTCSSRTANRLAAESTLRKSARQ